MTAENAQRTGAAAQLGVGPSGERLGVLRAQLGVGCLVGVLAAMLAHGQVPCPATPPQPKVEVVVAFGAASADGAARLSDSLPTDLDTSSGLRRLASPARLWIEGHVESQADGRTTPSRRFLFAGFEPYFVEIMQDVAVVDAETSRYRISLPGVWARVVARGPEVSLVTGEVGKLSRSTASREFWREGLVHFFEPRWCDPARLGEGVRCERTSTATRLTIDLGGSRRELLFDASGLLVERRAMPNQGPGPSGMLRFAAYREGPLFPRSVLHERYEADGRLVERTRWTIEVVRPVASLAELERLVPFRAALARLRQLNEKGP